MTDIVTALHQPPTSVQQLRATTTVLPRYLLNQTVDSKIGSERTFPVPNKSPRSHGEIYHRHSITHGWHKADRLHQQDP